MASNPPQSWSSRAHNGDKTAAIVCIVLAVVVVLMAVTYTAVSIQPRTTTTESADVQHSTGAKSLPTSVLQTFRLVTYEAKLDRREMDIEAGLTDMEAPGSVTVEKEDLELPEMAHCREGGGIATIGLTRMNVVGLPARVDQSECSICMHAFNTNDKIRVLPCKHDFHQACIDPWLVGFSGTCPVW